MNDAPTNVNFLFTALAEAVSRGGDAAAYDMVAAAPIVGSTVVVDFSELAGIGVPDRKWDTVACRVAASLSFRLGMLDAVTVDIVQPSDINGVATGGTLLPIGGHAAIAGVYDNNSDAVVALIALGDDDENLQLMVRVALEPDTYKPEFRDMVTNLRNLVTGVSDVEGELARVIPIDRNKN